MQNHHDVTPWRHDHSFGQEVRQAGEARTLVVIAISAAMMLVEIAAGIAFGSMALLADGLHMASHVAALGISAVAYAFARRHAHNREFCFGTGKVNALGGFTGAVLLATFALLMVWESGHRLLRPEPIAFDQAILVAVAGLLVNGIAALVLGHGHDHSAGHSACSAQHDHNLRSAYLHVLADATTSVLAIVALLAGKWYGLAWLDPLIGVLGAIVVAHWSLGLLRDTGAVLLDREGPAAIREQMVQAIELHDDNRVADLHLWSIGPGIYAAEIIVVTHTPQGADHYKAMLPDGIGLAHVIIEVQRCLHADDKIDMCQQS